MSLHPATVVALLVFASLTLYWAFSGGRTVDLWWFVGIATFHVGMYYMAYLPEVRRSESFIRDIAA